MFTNVMILKKKDLLLKLKKFDQIVNTFKKNVSDRIRFQSIIFFSTQ